MSRVEERNAWLFFSFLQAKVGRSVVSRLDGVSAVEAVEMSREDFALLSGCGDRVSDEFARLKGEFDPAGVSAGLSERGIEVVTLADLEYPGRLREISDPPPALFVHGEIPAPPYVAVVGSRKATPGALEASRKLGRRLGERGVCVVSGLALGVDGEAHRGALSAAGMTLGVLGCGIDIVYPKKHHELFEEVKRRGSIFSEYYLGEAPLAWRFPARNRIVAGICDTVVVVEAAEKSGALITARHALEAGRDVWAIPGPVGVDECRGSNKLLADGAGVLWDLDEFADHVAPEQRKRTETPEIPEEIPPELPANEAAALAGVGFEATEVDVIGARSGLSAGALISALTMLELKGYVAKNSGGAYARRAAP